MKAKGVALTIVLAVAVLFVCEAVAQIPTDLSFAKNASNSFGDHPFSS